MVTHYEDDAVTLHHGDCVEVMESMEPDSVDSVVCDPPYELGFMGRAWDSSGVAYRAETWAAALRVLKPGGHLLAFGGTRTYHRMTVAIEDAGFEVRDCIAWMYGQGFPKSHNLDGGRGTALKPAYEPIVVARKPLTGTVAANVLEHGTGALNIDATRVGMSDADREFIEKSCRPNTRGAHDPRPDAPIPDTRVVNVHASGRWPANVVLDEAAAQVLDLQSGTIVDRNGGTGGWRESYVSGTKDADTGTPIYRGEGGASRFFYCAKASKADRGPGNNHPTVKPVQLMRWLVRLVTPPGGTVLDPFAGSGTTAQAAIIEGLRAILIEAHEPYLPIIVGRITQPLQPDMFGTDAA